MSDPDATTSKTARALLAIIVGVALIGLVIAIYSIRDEPPPPPRGSTPVPAQAAAAQGASPAP